MRVGHSAMLRMFPMHGFFTGGVFAAWFVHRPLFDPGGDVDNLHPRRALPQFRQQGGLEGHVDLKKQLGPAQRRNLPRRRLEGVRILTRLDQHLDGDVRAADLLDQICHRRDARNGRQPAVGRLFSGGACAAETDANRRDDTAATQPNPLVPMLRMGTRNS